MAKGELLIRNENIQYVFDWFLDKKFMVNRKYQRKLVWTFEEKQKLINSIVNNFPIPLFLLAKDEEYEYYEIIDGLQRLEAIFAFLQGDFPVDIGSEHGYFDLNTMAKTKELLDNGILKQNTPVLNRKTCSGISNYQLPLSISSFESEQIEEIFRRINATGRQLSQQDLRQAGSIGIFSDLVRNLASYIRRDSSKTDLLELSKMKEISLSNRNLNYGINLNNVFWVQQDIILLQNMRISRDEELIAYILMYILLDKSVNPTAKNLDIIYGYESNDPFNLVTKIISSITNNGVDNIKTSFIRVFDELEKICSYSKKSLSRLLFESYGERMMRSFQVLFLSFYEMLIFENKAIKDYKAIASGLNGLGSRNLSDIASDKWNASYRNEKIHVIKSLISNFFKNNEQPNTLINMGIGELENLLMYSKTEHQLFELKIGLHSLNANCEFNDSCLKKIIKTLTAMANTDRKAEGYIILGVADDIQDAELFKKLYKVDPKVFNSFYITGLQEEIKRKYNGLDDYFNRIKQYIEKEPIEPYTISYILGNMRLISYYDKDILVFKIKSSSKPLLYDNAFYERRGSNNEKLEGQSLIPLIERFSNQ
jgi:uncharacterized protein with ParB-like and HNH nuclease domain